MNSLDKKYTNLLQDILDNGVKKEDRTGTGTLSVFGRQIRHKMSEGFPLITTKKMYFKGIVTELLWFLRGDTNIKYLIDNNCHIWDGDCYKKFKNQFDWLGETNHLRPNEFFNDSNEILTKEEFIDKIKTDDDFAKKWGELGPVYGKQWRNWGRFEYEGFTQEGSETSNNIDVNWKKPIDQIANLINDLKTNPDSRRLMVSAWNPGELDQMTLPPCHYGFQVYTRELSLYERIDWWFKNNKPNRDVLEEIESSPSNVQEKYFDGAGVPTKAISLMWSQRSADVFLGIPFNIASYGLLLEIIAKEVNMIPDELIGNLGDTHLYLDHIEQAKEQIGRELSLEERTELARGIVVPLLGSKEDSYNEAGIAKRTREPFPLATLILDDWYSTQGDPLNTPQDISKFLKDINIAHIRVENYQSHPAIKAPLSN
jgi:thymidylate synthase